MNEDNDANSIEEDLDALDADADSLEEQLEDIEDREEDVTKTATEEEEGSGATDLLGGSGDEGEDAAD